MIFVDTNFFLRFLLKDIAHQYNEAEALFIQAADGEINLVTSTVVIFEIERVLGDFYGLEKTEIIPLLETILQLKINLSEVETIQQAIDLYKTTNLDLEDCYNLFYAKQLRVEDFKTFDEKLKKKFHSL